MRLKAKQRCPIPGHGFNCKCHPEEPFYRSQRHSKWERVRTGVSRIKDENSDHPDGYRYRLSPAEMRKVIYKKIIEQNGLCSIGGEELTDMNDVVPDHKSPRGMNGARRDDRSENIGAACSFHNNQKGSQRI